MTAAELIQHLQSLPPDMLVVVAGYEDGYNDISVLKPVHILRDEAADWYYGAYANSDVEEAIDAVMLFGENKNNKSI